MKFGIEVEFLGLDDDVYQAVRSLRNEGLTVSSCDDGDEWNVHSDSSIKEERGMPECYCEFECGGHTCNCKIGVHQTDRYHYSPCEGDEMTCKDCGWEETCDCELQCNCEPEYDGGVELVSKPLEYCDASFAEIEKAFKILEDLECYTNNSCGFHVHVDMTPAKKKFGADAIPAFFTHCIEKYAKVEAKLDEKMNNSRRNSNNFYCKTMHGKTLAMCERDRYHKLNVMAYTRHGTLEFRHHHGTIDKDEALDWIRFCHGFIEEAMEEFEVNQDYAEMCAAIS